MQHNALWEEISVQIDLWGTNQGSTFAPASYTMKLSILDPIFTNSIKLFPSSPYWSISKVNLQP